ncbi:MAG: terminase, partial [Firmicutes bacterium]|nr:terminase [Bacillota bacterium]
MNGKGTLHRYQLKAMLSPARFIGLIAGTGGGKTFFGPIWLLKQVRDYPQDSFFVIAPTFPLFNRTTMPEFRKRFDYDPDLKGEYKEQKKEYRLGTGGIIYFGSADRPDSLEGGQVRAVWCDEAGQIKLASWQAIQRRLGVKMGRCLLTTTPYSLNWLKTDFYDPWKAGDSDYDVIQFSSIDSPYYPRKEYERAKRTLDRRIFEMRYMGLFRKMAGLVYAEFTN